MFAWWLPSQPWTNPGCVVQEVLNTLIDRLFFYLQKLSTRHCKNYVPLPNALRKSNRISHLFVITQVYIHCTETHTRGGRSDLVRDATKTSRTAPVSHTCPPLFVLLLFCYVYGLIIIIVIITIVFDPSVAAASATASVRVRLRK